MKKLLLLTLLASLSTNALAEEHGRYYAPRYYGHGGGGGWVAPLVIGGVAGYVLAQPRQPQTVIVQQPQVVQPLPSYVPANGEPIYQYQNIYDANCSCYQRVLVQIN